MTCGCVQGAKARHSALPFLMLRAFNYLLTLAPVSNNLIHTYMRPTCALFILSMLTLFTACKKDSGKKFTIDNRSNGQDLNVAIYASESDYINSTNSIAGGVVAGNDVLSLPASKLNKGTTYYVDAYSSDYMYTNWANGDDPIIGRENETPRKFTYTGEDMYSIVSVDMNQTNSRISLINKNEPMTRWHAIDALDLSDGTSVWSTMQDEERFAGITISKNSRGTFSYIYGGDTVTSHFSMADLVGYPIFRVIPNETGLHFFIVNTSVNPALAGPQPTTIDKVVALINNNLYVLVRE